MNIVSYLFGQNAANYAASSDAHKSINTYLPKNGTLSRDISRLAAKVGLLFLGCHAPKIDNTSIAQMLVLGDQQADTSYFVGYNDNKEAMFLFLQNADDIETQGPMTHMQAINVFEHSADLKGYQRSQYQQAEDIEAHEADGGIRQFTANEWQIIIHNLMDKMPLATEPAQESMRQLHLALKNSVGKNAEWIHTASLNEQGKAVLINIATGKVIEDEPDVYCAKVFSGRALKLAA